MINWLCEPHSAVCAWDLVHGKENMLHNRTQYTIGIWELKLDKKAASYSKERVNNNKLKLSKYMRKNEQLDIAQNRKWDLNGRLSSDPPENCHLNVKKLPKTWHFFFLNDKNCLFFPKNCHEIETVFPSSAWNNWDKGEVMKFALD